MRTCVKCNEEKENTEFNVARNKDGLTSTCKSCINTWNRIKYANNHHEFKERKKRKRLEYYYRNKESESLKSLIRDRNNPKSIERRRLYAIKQAEWEKFKLENPDYKKNNIKEWRVKNRELRNSKLKIRINSDPKFKLRARLRTRLWQAVRNAGGIKSAKTFQLTGCTPDELGTYIESLFTYGMTWSNHGRGAGKWHVDHIIPCDSFDLANPEDQRKCFHYTNLQPLWGEDNIRKSNKILTHQVSLRA